MTSTMNSTSNSVPSWPQCGAWTADPSSRPYAPNAPNGRIIAAVLTTRRPATLATKIAHVWNAAHIPGSEAALERLGEEVLAECAARGDVLVKWQSDRELGLPSRLGFERMRDPYRSAAGTEGVVGYARWFRAKPHHEPPYYAQTSTFTRAAVAALLALEIRGKADSLLGHPTSIARSNSTSGAGRATARPASQSDSPWPCARHGRRPRGPARSKYRSTPTDLFFSRRTTARVTKSPRS